MENEEFPVIHNGVDFDAIERNSNDENVRMVLENLEIEKKTRLSVRYSELSKRRIQNCG